MKLNLRKIFQTNQTLFVSGETGVGKSCLVKQLTSRYKPGQRCVVVNMASIGDVLFESQMYGHKRGSFTGAHQDHQGYLEVANNGVLFLDEIADLSLRSQKKLLELLEERTFSPVGSTFSKKFEGMIVLASHKNLLKMVKDGQFREDLFYRIFRFNIDLAPLRDKRDEIELALATFQHKLSLDVWYFLTREYQWPGNFRELKNFRDALDFYHFDRIDSLADLPLIQQKALEEAYQSTPVEFEKYASAIKNFEKMFFEKAITLADGRVNYASERLGISKTTLIAKLKKYGISSLQIKALSHAA